MAAAGALRWIVRCCRGGGRGERSRWRAERKGVWLVDPRREDKAGAASRAAP